MKFHLYILPARGDGDPEGAKRAMKSFGNLPMQVTTGIRGHQLWIVGAHYADWYGYIFDDEELDINLMNALPLIMQHEKTDYFVFFKKEKGNNGKIRFTIAPRIFRWHVTLCKGLLIPTDNGRLKAERILDGWVLKQ